VVISKPSPEPVVEPPPEPPAAPVAPKRARAPRVLREVAPAPPPPAPPPPASPFAAKLAQVKAAPESDLRFELADEVEAAADETLSRQAAAVVKACLAQFRITGGARHLEECVQKFERASRSDMNR
jgi:hypothetical protein